MRTHYVLAAVLLVAAHVAPATAKPHGHRPVAVSTDDQCCHPEVAHHTLADGTVVDDTGTIVIPPICELFGGYGAAGRYTADAEAKYHCPGLTVYEPDPNGGGWMVPKSETKPVTQHDQNVDGVRYLLIFVVMLFLVSRLLPPRWRGLYWIFVSCGLIILLCGGGGRRRYR